MDNRYPEKYNKATEENMIQKDISGIEHTFTGTRMAMNHTYEHTNLSDKELYQINGTSSGDYYGYYYDYGGYEDFASYGFPSDVITDKINLVRVISLCKNCIK